MKTINKFLSILLATILILSLFPVTLAQASEPAITFTAETDAKNVKVGDTISVSVRMSEYDNVGALILYVNYDNTALKILDAQTNEVFGYEEFNTAYEGNKFAYLIISANTKTVSGTLFTVQFEVLKEGCTEVSLAVNELADIDLNALSSSTQSAKIHNFDKGTVTQPTCTDKGYTTYVCTCGFTCQADETSAKGHNYDYDNGILTRPTETEKGYYTYTCMTDASHTTTVTVESADYSAYDEAFGKVVGYLYGTDLTDEAKTELLTTVQNYMASNPNFDAQGNLRRDLIESEQALVDNATNFANQVLTVVEGNLTNCTSGNHDVRNYTSNNNATCTKNGTKTGKCYVCGAEVTVEDENAPALKHDIIIDNAVEPDCLNTGLKEGSHCSRCDYKVAQETVPALGHNMITDKAVEPDCLNTGLTEGSHCSRCDYKIAQEIVPATGHSYTSTITKPATHTEDGVMTYICGCGDTYTKTIDATGDHFYTPTVTPPTCTEKGFTTYTCVCNETYVDDYVDATGHKYESEITIPATHLAEGLMTYTCHCNDSYTKVIEKIAEHNYEAVVTPPTCTENGFTTYTCECGNSYVDNETSATGHSFSKGNCTACGEKDPDYCGFSIKEPSRTTIRNKDGIILHTEFDGKEPEGSYVVWTSNNDNFDETATREGKSLKVIANDKGNTTFTATLYDVNGNVLATDSVELYSQSGFFDKIGGFFRNLFGVTKIYNM